MTTRRSFLSLFPALACAPRLIAAREICKPLNYDYGLLGATPLSDGKPFTFPKADPRPRPLWSQLGASEQTALAARIQSAYTAMTARTIRDHRDLGGLVGQAWLHYMACQNGLIHGNSYFLPWHRAFLYFHERWLQKDAGPDFRLPVWDWETNPKVPAIFDWLSIPGPDQKPIGCQYLKRADVDPIDLAKLQSWTLSHAFYDFAGGHFGGNAAMGVHSDVHGQVGGLMADPQGSALHPIFYMHHANVDRYWCAWWRDYHLHDGFTQEWLNGPMFFADPDQGIVKVYAEQVAPNGDLGYNNQLGYTYALPRMTLYQPTNICAVPDTNTVSVNPNGFFPLFTRLVEMVEANPGMVAVEVGNRLATLFSVESLEKVVASVKGSLEGWYQAKEFPFDPAPVLRNMIGLIAGAFSSLALPIQVSLTLQDLKAGASYPVLLAGSLIGHVTLFGGHGDHPHRVFCAASLGLKELSGMLPNIPAPGLHLSVGASDSGDPAPTVLNIDGFDILYPRLTVDGQPIGDDALKRYLGLS